MASSVPAPSGSVITVASSSSSAAAAAVRGTGWPCAACKFLRRKCQPDCVFAPYFPLDNPQKFVHVHRVFGASNVTKLLNELHPFQREDAVNSLAYEADMRLRDPVYGCVGVISILQHNLRQLQQDLARAKYELSKFQAAAAASASTAAPSGPQAMAEFISNAMPNGGHNFINIEHSAALGSLGGSGAVFGQEPFANVQMLSARSYDGEPTRKAEIVEKSIAARARSALHPQSERLVASYTSRNRETLTKTGLGLLPILFLFAVGTGTIVSIVFFALTPISSWFQSS